MKKERGVLKIRNKRKLIILGLVVILCLVINTAVYAEAPNISQGQGQKISTSQDTVTPQDVGGNYGGSYISLNSTGTALWYSGNFSSANTWISASCQSSLQWMSPLGGSWQTEVTNPKVYKESAKTMSTPTYTFPSVTWGYWRSRNSIVAYWPSNIIPSSLSGTVNSEQLYYEQ